MDKTVAAIHADTDSTNDVEARSHISEMRTYRRKTDRVRTPVHVLESAEKAVRNGGRSVRGVSAEFEINFMKLHRFCSKKSAGLPVVARQEHTRQTFMKYQEVELVKATAKMYRIMYLPIAKGSA